MKSSVKKGLLLGGGLVALILLVVVALGLSYYNQARRTLEQVTEAGPAQREVQVYVLQEDPAQTLSDTVDYRYGVTQGEDREETVARLEETLGRLPEVQDYPTAFALADALRQGECQAVLLEEGYQKSLGDARGYEWTQEGMRSLGGIRISQEAVESLPAPEGTPQRFLLYLSGSDTFGDISTRSRSDVNILAAVNVPEKELFLLATPRDFYVSFERTGEDKDKLAHTGLYGVETSVEALEELYGVEIDYYLRMNFTGFVDIIDALGGVSVYSDRTFTVENICTYQEGYNQLTGIEALAFARERMSFPEGDYQRAKNQMEVIRAVVEKAASPALLWNFPSVLQAVEGNFETNLPEDQILSLAPSLAGDWKIETYTASGQSAYRETWSMPGQELYVILPDEASLQEARARLEEVLEKS